MNEAVSHRPGSVWSSLAAPAGPIDEYEDLVDALREFQDVMTAVGGPRSAVAEATAHVRAATAILRPTAVPEDQQIIGHRGTPGRAQAMIPQLFIDTHDADSVEGHVTFGRFYLGGGGAAHGGAVPLVFDEILGRLANTGGRSMSRTAYLNVDYRAIAPIGVELQVLARVDSEVGRKRFLSAEIMNGDVICAEVHALFVALREGQP